MLQITLSDEEKMILEDLLQCCLAELRDEIHHTDDMEYKDMLKSRRNVVQKILQEVAGNKDLSQPVCK